MKEDSAKRLERALLKQKLKWAAVAGLVVAALGLGLYFRGLDASIASTRIVPGTIVYVGPLQGKYRAVVAESNLQVDVRLDDSRVVHLSVPRDRAPKLGDPTRVAEHTHGSGRHTFAWP